jgi:hypothetical protein
MKTAGPAVNGIYTPRCVRSAEAAIRRTSGQGRAHLLKIRLPMITKPLLRKLGLFASLLGATTATAQVVANPTADSAWTNVTALVRTTQTVGNKTPTQVAADRPQQAQQQRQAAAAAKAFYDAYPSDKNAAQAKKLEATYGLLGVLDGDATHETAALLVAKIYRENKANPLADRFEVAHLAERVQARARLGGKTFGRTPAELEKIAGKLQLEFGDVPPVFDHYAGIARGADAATARRIATNLSQWPAASAPKAEAQAILARDALVGKPLGVRLTRTNGQTLDLAQPAGQRRLLYIWAPRADDIAPPRLAPLATALGGTQVVYLLVGVKAARAQSLAAAAPAGSLVCFSENGLLHSSLEPLKTRQSPFAFLLSAAGTVTSFGPVNELSNLLAASR